jgi:hypothetical protein
LLTIKSSPASNVQLNSKSQKGWSELNRTSPSLD